MGVQRLHTEQKRTEDEDLGKGGVFTMLFSPHRRNTVGSNSSFWKNAGSAAGCSSARPKILSERYSRPPAEAAEHVVAKDPLVFIGDDGDLEVKT